MAPTTVMLHGFTHTGASWDPVVAALGESYRAIAPDLRGHGDGSARVPVGLDEVIGDIGELTGGASELVGYSMGGRVALHAALALPGRVRRLVLIGASPGLADPGERAARRAADEALADELQGLAIEVFAERWARTPALAGQPPDVLARVNADRLRNTPAGLARALRGLGTGALPSLWGRLGELAMPVTLIVGERDDRFRAIAAQMADRFAAANVVVVEGAGHAVHLERPSAVAAALTA